MVSQLSKIKRILYCGPFRFPDGDAGAQRVIGLGHVFNSLGVPVEFIGWTNLNSNDGDVVSPVRSYLNFAYRTVSEFRDGQEGPLARLKHHLWQGRKTLGWLKQNWRLGDVVVLYNFYGANSDAIIRFCRFNSIPIIIDAVEWYSPHQCAGGRYGLVRWEVEYSLRRSFRKANGIIAISSYLQRHFSKSNQTILIPPLIDVADQKWINQSLRPSTIRVCYSGFPGKKDLLGPFLKACSALERLNIPIDVVLIGPSKEEIFRAYSEVGLPFTNHSICLGRLPHLSALAEVAASDFSVLIRPNLRYAQAGFSTKFVESMALGTPCICNLTSDIGVYSIDGENAIHMEGISEGEILHGLKRAARTDLQARARMRTASRAAAERFFDWRRYQAPLSKFMESIAQQSGNF